MRQAAFRKEENINLEGLTYPSADKQFLQSIMDSIEQHLEESEFDLEQLSTEMGMSKSTLYRKIKSITGLTPLDFVRNVKMKRACMMLLAGHRIYLKWPMPWALVLPNTSRSVSKRSSALHRVSICRKTLLNSLFAAHIYPTCRHIYRILQDIYTGRVGSIYPACWIYMRCM